MNLYQEPPRARVAAQALRRRLWESKIGYHDKVTLFRCLIVTVLRYGCETNMHYYEVSRATTAGFNIHLQFGYHKTMQFASVSILGPVQETKYSRRKRWTGCQGPKWRDIEINGRIVITKSWSNCTSRKSFTYSISFEVEDRLWAVQWAVLDDGRRPGWVC